MSNFKIMNIFAAQPNGGTTLAIVPDADGMTEGQMQSLAQELGHPMTVFLFTPRNRAHAARLRFFNPAREVAFAGQAIIGTTVYLSREGRAPNMLFELPEGIVAAWAKGSSAVFTIETKLRILARPEIRDVTAALSLKKADIDLRHHRPVLASVGLPFTLTEVNSRRALEAVSPNLEAFQLGHKLYPSSFDFAQYCYFRKGNEIHARMFSLQDGIVEDPATGSAAAVLAAFLTALDGNQSLNVYQGTYTRCPSVLQVRTTAKSVSITGTAVPVVNRRQQAA